MTAPEIPRAWTGTSGGELHGLTRAVLDSLAAHIAVIDSQGVIIAVNRAWEDFARANGQPRLEGLGPGINYLHVCDTATGPWADEGGAVAAGIRAVLAGARSSFTLEYPCHSPTQQRWFQLSVTPLADGTAGAVIAHHNITERVRAEHERQMVLEREQAARQRAEQIAERNARMHALTSALSAAVTPEEVARQVVDQCVEAFGARAGALLALTEDQRHLELVYSAGYDPADIAPWRRFLLNSHVMLADAIRGRTALFHESAEAFSATYPDVAAAIARSGTQAVAAIPIALNERIFGGIALSFGTARTFSREDRTFAEALATQCAQALDRARLYHEAQLAAQMHNELLSSVSHDLRTPLATIKGTAQLLARQANRGLGERAAPLVSGLARIDATTTRMARLIDELLDAARLRAGEPLELQRAEMDLVGLVRRAVSEQQQAAPRHHLQLRTEVDAITGVWDAARLNRVIDNLLSNAVKYSPDGGEIAVSVTLQPEDTSADAPRWATVTVTDSGIGIPAADLPFIFQRYRRGSNVRGYIPGNGLGLAGAKQIVEQHGGRLMITSEEGRGTTVTFSLPG